jgi:uncharacterized membrane protein
MTKNRLEAFSDGVFAIVITLLVIEIHSPEVGEGDSLAAALFDQWPSYAAYLVSFLIIGVMWLNHHRIFNLVAKVDGPLLLLNLNLLMWMALIPFPTGVAAEYLLEGGEQASTGLALYGGVILLAAISFSGLYAWVTHDARLMHALPPPDVVRASRIRFSIGIAAYGFAFALSWVSAPLALGLHGVMALYYASDQLTMDVADDVVSRR